MKEYNRRDFLKVTGTVAATTALASCGAGDSQGNGKIDYMGHHTGPVPTDKMTYRRSEYLGLRLDAPADQES